MLDAAQLYPRATAFIKGATREGLVMWLTEYPIGRCALRALEFKLNRNPAAARQMSRVEEIELYPRFFKGHEND